MEIKGRLEDPVISDYQLMSAKRNLIRYFNDYDYLTSLSYYYFLFFVVLELTHQTLSPVSGPQVEFE